MVDWAEWGTNLSGPSWNNFIGSYFFFLGRGLTRGVAEIGIDDALVACVDDDAWTAGVMERKAFEAPGSVKGRGAADGGEGIIVV